jgi:hypothetical protein
VVNKIRKLQLQLWIAPLIVAAAYTTAILAVWRGHEAFMAVHAPLELVIVTCSIVSAITVARLWNERRNGRSHILAALIANAVVLAVLGVQSLLGIIVAFRLR